MVKTLTTTNGVEFLIDDEDYEEVSKYRWNESGGYIMRTDRSGGGKRTARVYRDLL